MKDVSKMADFKEMLKYFRKLYGLSQADLAYKLGLKPSTISMYEVGEREPNFETEEKIADFFNVDLNTLRGKDVELSAATSQRTLSPDQEELLAFYDKLNASGKQKVKEYASDLTEQKKYIEAESSGKQPTQSA